MESNQIRALQALRLPWRPHMIIYMQSLAGTPAPDIAMLMQYLREMFTDTGGVLRVVQHNHLPSGAAQHIMTQVGFNVAQEVGQRSSFYRDAGFVLDMLASTGSSMPSRSIEAVEWKGASWDVQENQHMLREPKMFS